MGNDHIASLVDIACIILGVDGLRINEHSEFVKFNEVNDEDERYGELHIGQDEDLGTYQILDQAGRGLFECRFFDEV